MRMYADPGLREPGAPVGAVDDDLRKLASDLFQTLREWPGVGLAATQVGILRKVFVFDLEEGGRGVCVNPEITWESEETELDEEGCLSLPLDIRLNIPRSTKIRFRCMNLDGKTEEYEVEGFKARVFQHEVDHLNGNLIIDRASAAERREALRELRERLIVQELAREAYS